MFRAAKFLVQHKVGAVAVIALGVFVAMPGEDENAGKASNPWSAQPAATTVASTEEGVVDQIIAEADTMLAESGYDPREAAAESGARIEGASESVASANGN